MYAEFVRRLILHLSKCLNTKGYITRKSKT